MFTASYDVIITAGDYGSGALHTSKLDGISKAKPNASGIIYN